MIPNNILHALITTAALIPTTSAAFCDVDIPEPAAAPTTTSESSPTTPSPPPPPPRPPIVRWLPLGDSITDNGCWRAYIWSFLQRDACRTHRVEIVGSQSSPQNCTSPSFAATGTGVGEGRPSSIPYDRDHEGHPGFLATNISRLGLLPGWLAQNPADVVTVHLGTNDVYHGRGLDPVTGSRVRIGTDEILAALGVLVGEMRGVNPEMKIVVAQIIPLPKYDAHVRELNAAIPAWAASLNSTTSPIWVVDLWTGFDPKVDLFDGIHPSVAGDLKIAERVYRALKSLAVPYALGWTAP